MFLVNIRSMHVLPRVVDTELMQSKLNLDFIIFTKFSLLGWSRARIRFRSLQALATSAGVSGTFLDSSRCEL
jgi:hypothetical protein